ncbi:MAG: hypothetical protein NTZ64_18015 [Polaromonas sp.]|nr:hypothetical protein [Polaromonas sp.]
MNLNQEIAALRRIENFEGVDHGPYGPGMFEFDKHYTIQIDTEGWLRATIDFYSQKRMGQRVCYRKSVSKWVKRPTSARLAWAISHAAKHDDDALESQQMVLRVSLVNRDEFRFLHQIVRVLLSGKTANLNGAVLSRKLHLDEAAKDTKIRYEYRFEQLDLQACRATLQRFQQRGANHGA